MIAPALKPLTAAFRKGDEDAARELWAALAPRLLAVARNTLGEAEADGGGPEDAVQRAFLAMLKLDAKRWRTVEDPRAWLVVTTRNEAKMMVRTATRRRAREHGRDGAGSHAPDDTGVISTINTDDAAALRDAVRSLDDPLREAVTLRHVGGLTFEQLGEALGVSKSGAVQRYRQAVAKIQDFLAASRRADSTDPTSRSQRHA